MNLWELADLSTPWCIHVASTLRIADHLSNGITEIAPLAAAAGAHPDSLYRVLRYLVGKGIFEEPAPGRFALNDVARQFLSGPLRLGLDLDSIGGRMAYTWSTLLAAVRTGEPAYQQIFGRTFWDDLEAHPQIGADFDALMGPPGHGIPDPNALVNPEDWQSIRTVVDVGGGTGAFLAEILRAHPTIRGTLIDLPRTVAGSAEIFQAAGVQDRVTPIGQSFFDPLPAGADLYFLRKVLGDWPDRDAAAILHRCAEAARPSGRVVVFSGAAPSDPADPALLMLVLLGGRERSFDELSTLAHHAGLAVYAVGRQAPGRVIIEFKPL